MRTANFPLLLFFAAILLCPPDTLARDSVINDPAISRRCEQLLFKRNRKKSYCQKLVELISRNQRLQKITPQNKKSVKSKLTANMRKLKQRLKLGKLRLEKYEEDIIKKGCPGIQI
ncbi:MAG: hypothetical protein OXB84_05750 [Halobacteriovoraceae bacterium]|nr:hypothetical protein [Halobacteriovoraceae bacterium]